MIKINNVKIPVPSSYAPSIMDITKAERNSKGDMQIDLINKKYKLELSWNFLEQDDMTALLNALEANVTFQVEFIDPKSGKPKTATFYKGDRSMGILDFINGAARWKDIKVNLIEV